jgi:hypothetical protein
MSPFQLHTASSVKATLPSVDVEVRTKGKRIAFYPGCRVYGRMNDFAGVAVPGQFSTIEFSWESIVSALNNGKALKVSS